MKRTVLIIALLISVKNVLACDICGCSSGNYFIEPFPMFHKHFFGLRYTFRHYNSLVAKDASQFSQDFYQTYELWGGINIGKKWQLIAFVPYNVNQQNSDDGLKKSSGLGDITAIANYNIFSRQSRDSANNRISHQLWIGGGFKLPTGKFAADREEIIPDANNQPGTGSVDFILNAMYSFHVNDWGLNSNLNYKMNTAAKGFEFGNRFNASAFLFRSLIFAHRDVSPNLGVLYERSQANKLDKTFVEETGGHVLLGSAGLETNFGKLAIGFNAQFPLNQNLSDHQTQAKTRGMLHVGIAF